MNTVPLNTGTEFDAVLRGPSTSSLSSRRLNWRGYLTERHLAGPGERPETISDHHVVCLWLEDVPICEYSGGDGESVTYFRQRNSMTIVPQGIVPAVHPQGQVDFILCALEPDFVKNVEMELDQKPIVAPFYRRVHLDPAMSGLTKLLSHEAAKGGLSGRLYADQLATALAIRLLFLERQEGRREFCKASALPRHRLRRVIERMRELQSDLDLKTLATESGYSRTHFLRMFRESMGCTPHQYLLRLRLERARELLRQKRMSLIDIAALCGFSSHAHLSRMFRQVVGVPPSEYRRSL